MLNMTQMSGFGGSSELLVGMTPAVWYKADNIPSSADVTTWANSGSAGSTYDITSGGTGIPGNAAYGTGGYNGLLFASGDSMVIDNMYTLPTNATFGAVGYPTAELYFLGGVGAPVNHSEMSIYTNRVGVRDSAGMLVSFNGTYSAWNRVIVKKTGTSISIFVNGTLVVTDTVSTTIKFDKVGSAYPSSVTKYSDGYIQEIVIYDNNIVSVTELDAYFRNKFSL